MGAPIAGGNFYRFDDSSGGGESEYYDESRQSARDDVPAPYFGVIPSAPQLASVRESARFNNNRVYLVSPQRFN